MTSSTSSDPFIRCLDDLSKLIDIRSRFYLRDILKLQSKHKFVNRLKDTLSILINNKAKVIVYCAPSDIPIDQTIRIGELKSMLHKQDLKNPDINNLYGRALFQVAAQLKESPRPMTVEHMWQVAEICGLCDAGKMDGFEKVLGKMYWKAFRAILEKQLAWTELQLSVGRQR